MPWSGYDTKPEPRHPHPRKAIDRLYNSCLGEALRRLEHLRCDPRFEQAKAMAKGKESTSAFASLEDEYGFTNAALMSHASHLRSSWIREYVGAQEAQAEGRDAFRATRRWSLGLGGKPKFRRHHKRKVHSAE